MLVGDVGDDATDLGAAAAVAFDLSSLLLFVIVVAVAGSSAAVASVSCSFGSATMGFFTFISQLNGGVSGRI